MRAPLFLMRLLRSLHNLSTWRFLISPLLTSSLLFSAPVCSLRSLLALQILGSKIHHKTELWTQLTESRWNSRGYFPRIHYIAAPPRSSTAHEQNGRTRTI